MLMVQKESFMTWKDRLLFSFLQAHKRPQRFKLISNNHTDCFDGLQQITAGGTCMVLFMKVTDYEFGTNN